MNIYTCEICNKSFKSAKSLTSHKNWHKPGYAEKSKAGSEKGRANQTDDTKNLISETLKTNSVTKYSINPKKCAQCEISIPYDLRYRKFCCPECESLYRKQTGVIHGPKPDENNENQIRKALKNEFNIPNNIKLSLFSKIELRICEKTGKKWWYNRTHCRTNPHLKTEKELYYKYCQFKFNVFHFPDLFDLSLIEKYGWYTCPGKKRKNYTKNVNGISRDHIVSINEGFNNNYDPYYISHPLNCKLMLHSENYQKGTLSDINYSDLMYKIKLWDRENYYRLI